MKKNILLRLGTIILAVAFFTGCHDDDDSGKAVNISIKGATLITGDIFAINITEGKPTQLEAFVMPQSAQSQPISFKFVGTPTGAIEMTESGMVTPLLVTPTEGNIPLPLGSDTIIVTVEDGSGTFVKYPVRVISNIVLVESITLQSAGQRPQIGKGKTFELFKYVTVNPANATDNTVSYASEDESIATVDENGVITAVGEDHQSTRIFVTANDRTKATASCIVTIGEPPLYMQYPVSEKWALSSNLGTKEGSLDALLDDKNSTFWAPEITTRPNYNPVCYLDIDLGEVIKFGQLGYRHRNLNYAHLQCHTFKLEAKKEVGDSWADLGERVTVAKQVDEYQLFEVKQGESDPAFVDARYIRITFIKGHLRDGKPDWNYSEEGNVSVGDLLVFAYNR